MLAGALALSGCNSLESNTAGAAETAATSDLNYNKLEYTLDTGINALRALHDSPGQSPDAFLQRFDLATAPIADVAESVESSRNDLREYGTKHVALLHEEAAKFTDPDQTKRLDSDANLLQAYYTAYDKESSGMAEPLAKARGYFADVRRVIEIDHSAKGVQQTLGTIDKAVAALREAKSEIPRARTALSVLRKNQPKPAAK